MQHTVRKSITVTKDSKLIIALGDSFVEGQGAVSEKTWEKFDWSEEKMTYVDYHSEEYFKVRDEEYENSFVNQLCKRHFTDFIPINFGYRGHGNRGPVKALTTLHPDLNLHLAKEKIVIFFVGQAVRFDFFNKVPHDAHNYFHTIWPTEPGENETPGVKNLWRGYATEVYTERTAALELISNIVEVQNWCKYNNAKLLLVNSFTYDFNKERMTKALEFEPYGNEINYLPQLIESIDWDNLAILPNNREQMIDILLDAEGREDLCGKNHGWYNWWRKEKSFTPNGYITPCSHPSPKGHLLIADTLAKIIKEKYYNEGK